MSQKWMSKVSWKTVLPILLLLILVGYNRGIIASAIVAGFIVAVTVNGIFTVQLIRLIQSPQTIKPWFWGMVMAVVLIDLFAISHGYGPHVIILGIALPIGFYMAIFADDWLRSKLFSLKKKSNEKDRK